MLRGAKEGLEWVSRDKPEEGPEPPLGSIKFHLQTLTLISKNF